MNMAKLNVHGDDTTLKSILDVLPTEPERQWRKGEPKEAGRVYLDSGFEVLIAQAAQAQTLSSRMRSYLAECDSRGVSFSMPRIVAELQFELQGDAQHAASLDLSLADLGVLGEMGISLSVAVREGGASAPTPA